MSNLTIPIRGNKLAMSVEVRGHLFSRQSEFQRIDIVDTLCFGRMLLLDNHIQLAELDEHAYHEALVQIPMMSLKQPRRALVVGGGDGGVVREILRLDSIKRVDMVEIDRAVIDACT
ncbi:MAG: spermidine synthase, partial [Fimbriimonadaceae bacterium]